MGRGVGIWISQPRASSPVKEQSTQERSNSDLDFRRRVSARPAESSRASRGGRIVRNGQDRLLGAPDLIENKGVGGVVLVIVGSSLQARMSWPRPRSESAAGFRWGQATLQGDAGTGVGLETEWDQPTTRADDGIMVVVGPGRTSMAGTPKKKEGGEDGQMGRWE